MMPAPLWKVENGNSKFEAGNWKFENGSPGRAKRQSKVGNLYCGEGQGRWTEEKKFTTEATKLLKTNSQRTN
jgi:hypothetical protein